MNKREIYFCSPALYESKLFKYPGGKRRLYELYEGFSEEEYSKRWVPGFINVLSIIAGEKKNAAVAIAFDERYLLLALLLRLAGCYLVFCPRGNKLEHHKYDHGRLRLKIYKYFFSFMYRYCDKMIFQTYAQQKEFAKLYNCNVDFKVIPNNINTTWMKELGQNKKYSVSPTLKRIGFLGGDDPRKGSDLLLDAFSKAKEAGLEATLILGGKYHDPPSLKDVEFIGYQDDLNQFYSSIDFLVVPSKYDSFPNTLMESLASKKPFLVAETNITKDICENAEILLFPKEVNSLAFKLRKVYSDSDTWCEIVKATQLLREKYSFNWADKMLETILNVS